MKSEDCGPECDCNKPSGNKKTKTVICLIILLAICGIFVYNAKTAKQSIPANTATAFAAPLVNEVNEQNLNITSVGKPETMAKVVDGEEAVQPIDEPTANVVDEKRTVGQFLDSLASLNKVAVNQDAVFVFVPIKGNDIISKETIDVIASAEQKIESDGASIGLYTLQSSSPEYANLSGQLTLPCMLIMSKGLGMGTVSGEITETKILQAYIASSRAGGCCPSGGGSAGCGPSSPALGPRVK